LELLKTKMDGGSEAKGTADATKSRKSAFTKAAVLAGALAGLAAAGCTDKITNNYYGADGGTTINNTTNNYGSDGGTQDTDTEQDTGVSCDTGPEVACEDPKLARYLSVGEKMDVGEMHFRVDEVFDDDGQGMVVVSIAGPDCIDWQPLTAMAHGESTELNSIFGTFRLSIDGVYMPSSGPSGAIIGIEKVCEEDVAECDGEELILHAILNQGEQLTFGLTGMKWRHDDISVYPTDEPPRAIESVLNGLDEVVAVAAIQEGDTVQIDLGDYRIRATANAVAPGYTFAAKWVDITVNFCDNSDI
jgi:hypothetical protein